MCTAPTCGAHLYALFATAVSQAKTPSQGALCHMPGVDIGVQAVDSAEYDCPSQRWIWLQGVYQYVPGKGEGFPEDFIPFKQMDAMVNAKY